MRIDYPIESREVFSFMHTLNAIFRWSSYGLAILALAASVGLLVGDVGVGILPGLSAAVASATPLLLAGISFLLMQAILRPRFPDLMKNVLLAATFLLWGAIQFMPQNALSIRLGNLVIALYVVDLAWMTLSSVIPRERD